MPTGFVYILECSDGSFYTGSTVDLELRITQHQKGFGANHTKKRLPVKLVYYETFQRIDDAFYREKQIQGWSRNKKLALIEKNYNDLSRYSECVNESHHKNLVSVASAPLSHQESAPLSHQESALLSHQESAPLSDQEFNSNNENSVNQQTFYSNGKLLLTGEYVVLDGALSLAIPTKLGQSLKVEQISEPKIVWESLDENGEIWFKDEFSIHEILSNSSKSKNEVSYRLIQILKEARNLNQEFLSDEKGFQIVTTLDFPKNWGLGTSSTLINNISTWAKVDAYELLSKTFGGSGYDIACAQHDSPITYQLIANHPEVKKVALNSSFNNNLYFVYLNKKQNSREGIAQYKSNKSALSKEISTINNITLEFINCSNLNEFQKWMDAHEQIISRIIKQTPIKELLFPDFEGSIKSLGAWGGDFVLVATEENPSNYFKSKGFDVIIRYQNLIK